VEVVSTYSVLQIHLVNHWTQGFLAVLLPLPMKRLFIFCIKSLAIAEGI